MPTIYRSGPYRFFFHSGDRDEPPHIHVERDDSVAKLWVAPVRSQKSGGFSATEIGRIQRIIIREQMNLIEAWDEYFGE
jgi:hypothetical protein